MFTTSILAPGGKVWADICPQGLHGSGAQPGWNPSAARLGSSAPAHTVNMPPICPMRVTRKGTGSGDTCGWLTTAMHLRGSRDYAEVS